MSHMPQPAGNEDRKLRYKRTENREDKRKEEHAKPRTVEPRSNGPATNGIPLLTDANSYFFQLVFFYFLCWQ